MLLVLECIAKKGSLTAAQVSEACSINRTVAHRLLNTLTKHRYAQKTSTGYELGPAAVDLARSALPSIITTAKSGMERLAAEIDETVILHCVSGVEAMAIDQVLSRNRLVMVRHTSGSCHALNRGASGWALLAFQSETFIERFMSSLPKESHAATAARIEQVQKDGFAISSDELQLGVHGLFVPIFNPNGTCGYSMGVLVPTIRADSLSGLEHRLISISQIITKQVCAPKAS